MWQYVDRSSPPSIERLKIVVEIEYGVQFYIESTYT